MNQIHASQLEFQGMATFHLQTLKVTTIFKINSVRHKIFQVINYESLSLKLDLKTSTLSFGISKLIVPPPK